MMQNSKNIYQAARMAAGITQERAAELIGTSVRSVAAYESDERIPADDVVVHMTEIYGTQFLAYQHLRKNMEIARTILPEVSPTNLPMAILRIQKEVNDFLKVRDEMTEITCDGIIDDREQERWIQITKELDDICQAIITLKFVGEGSI
ncbi:MAG: transcriptional regulator [Firmicutes bacterium HGW-Firmicutes-16]|nr:MAG: transcriptional regulator [Firmicutes bacterium HGW-Firmicutes-16]